MIKLMFILLILSLLSLSFCEYKQLSKQKSVDVVPDTKVYVDLSSYNTGDSISFQIQMDLSSGGDTSVYVFYIDQIPATSYHDSKYWNDLRQVRNGNVTCNSFKECTFRWKEEKREGNTYIFINPPEPFSNYYSSYGKKIKIIIVGDGGLSAGAIIAIAFGVFAFILILTVLIVCCCCFCNKNNNRSSLCSRFCDCCCCSKRYYGTTIQANVPFQPPIYPTPVPVAQVYPTPRYPVSGQVYATVSPGIPVY